MFTTVLLLTFPKFLIGWLSSSILLVKRGISVQCFLSFCSFKTSFYSFKGQLGRIQNSSLFLLLSFLRMLSHCCLSLYIVLKKFPTSHIFLFYNFYFVCKSREFFLCLSSPVVLLRLLYLVLSCIQ